MKWHFSPLPADQVAADITQRDQFNNDEVNISETIVREAVQNSLDAAVDNDGAVKVSFKWVDKESGINVEFFKGLFKGQEEHAKAAGLELDDVDFNKPEALIIEDFGTTGLTGKTNEKDNLHFSDFWRMHGKSHKAGTNRGRWGLGKLVYSSTSRVGVFFGLTVRAEDPDEKYLMGQTVLNLRTVADNQYPPHAYFSDLENKDDHIKRIPVPIVSKSTVYDFETNFSLERGKYSGLSLIIPFPDTRFNLKSMIGVAIGNYFYPIITGQLVLRFNDIEINTENVRELAREFAINRFPQLDLLFDFIEEVYKIEKTSSLIALKSDWFQEKKIDETVFCEEDLTSLRQKFGNGELVGITLPVSMKLKNNEIVKSKFAVYVKKPDNLLRGRDLYVRGGLTLPAEEKFKERCALGALIAEDEEICEFLGDAENAAHTQWITNTEKLRNKYRGSKPLVSIIKKSIVQFYDLLADISEDRDEDALVDFFWFDEPEAKKAKKSKKISKISKKPLVIPKFESRLPLFNINHVDDGFIIENADGLIEDKLPREIKVEVAYEVSKGNAFKKYSSHDFKVGKNGGITLEKNGGVEIISAKENSWKFEVTEIPFFIKGTGFDVNRDLKVKIKK